MITTFKEFILSESNDFEGIHQLSNFKFSNFKEISGDVSKIQKEMLRIDSLMSGSAISIIDQKSRSLYVNTLIKYVKTKTYNKLVEMMYGKGYKNPETDATVIVVDVETSSMASMKYGGAPKQIKMTRGDYFKMVWGKLDKYCDNAVEFLVKDGEVEDTVDDMLTLSKWAIVSIIIILLTKGQGVSTGGSILGTTGIGGAGVIAEKKAMQNIKKLVISKLKVKLEQATVISKSIWNILNNLVKENIYSYGFMTGMYLIYKKANEEFSKTQGLNDIRLTDDKEQLLDKLQSDPENKKEQIQKINSKLQSHSDFYLVFNWSGVVNMPGWKSWKEKNKKFDGQKITDMTNFSQDIGGVYTWYIAKYCVEFQNLLFEYCTLKRTRDAIERGTNN
jgi:hypothetical protein